MRKRGMTCASRANLPARRAVWPAWPGFDYVRVTVLRGIVDSAAFVHAQLAAHISPLRDLPSQPSDRCAKFCWPLLRWFAAQPRAACGRVANCMCLQRCSPRHRGFGLLRPALLICAFAHASPYCAVSSTPPPSYTPNMRHTYRPRAILPSQPTDRCAKYRPVPLHVRHTSHKPTPQPAQPARS